MLIPEETSKNLSQRLFTLAFKECGIDTVSNLAKLDYHEVIEYQNIFEKYLKDREKEMEKASKANKVKFKRPGKR